MILIQLILQFLRHTNEKNKILFNYVNSFFIFSINGLMMSKASFPTFGFAVLIKCKQFSQSISSKRLTVRCKLVYSYNALKPMIHLIEQKNTFEKCIMTFCISDNFK